MTLSYRMRQNVLNLLLLMMLTKFNPRVLPCLVLVPNFKRMVLFGLILLPNFMPMPILLPEASFSKLGYVWPTEEGPHIQCRALPEYRHDPNAELIQVVNPPEPPGAEERPAGKQRQLGIRAFFEANAYRQSHRPVNTAAPRCIVLLCS